MTGSTLPRRVLARHLRTLRETSGVSAEAARLSIGVGKQTLWRLETGQPVRLNPLFIERLCQVYGAGDDVTSMLLALTEEAGRAGWWHAYRDALPKHRDLFVGLEAAAKRIVSYQIALLPGIFQTVDYRRAITWIDSPQMPTAEVERRMGVFACRKMRLTDTGNPIAVDAILDESLLHRAIGGPAVMADQLEHLATLSDLPNVSLRVVPRSAHAYIGLSVGPFVILEFLRHPTMHLTEPPVVYLQAYTGALFLEKPEEVRQYRQVHVDLQRSALDEADSRYLIREIAKEYAV
ncbi:Helix-turn-helix domain-containing protein [Nocardia amikacinitolerans]|uniref:helix-turn-helix domain-containing protein n=1 Tax=Nocardia amikacinitolerans TaxID=756689 RepID=UPI00082AFFF4|nr:helix-turn-helix transcriptional regulator [Nocardia amikacinitolerans]MCP2315872.1 Helix-turn-helix domain-containing protein [Nocardia amikacinitolerans]